MSHWYKSMYCRSPHDKDLCVDILTEDDLAESLTSPTDACLIGIKICFVGRLMIKIYAWTYPQRIVLLNL